MGKVATTPNTRVWLDQFDISGFMNASQFDVMQTVLKTNGFSDVGPRRITDTYDHKHSHTAMFDGAAGQVDEVVNGLLGSDVDHYLAQAWGASVEGSVCYESVIQLADAPYKGALGQIQMLNINVVGAESVSRGLVLGNATLTGTGTRTGRNQGTTPSTSTYQAVIRVLGGTFISITVGVEQSSDDGGSDAYALITGLQHTFTVAGVVRLTFDGATEAYKRVNVSAFTGTNAIIVVTAGRVQGT